MTEPGEASRRDERVVPERSADDGDVGWERGCDERDREQADDERFLRERPPHWE